MLIKDTSSGYGIVSRTLHWGMAAAIVGMFALGWWMVGLTYYSPYYKSAPDLHRSIGITLFVLLIGRALWRVMNVKPDMSDLKPWERKAAHWTHVAFYPLILLLMISGYFISTLDGRAIDVFGLFSVPSVYTQKGLEDFAGEVHEILAYGVIGLAVVHAAAAIKHHVKDKSPILTRMWSGPKPN